MWRQVAKLHLWSEEVCCGGDRWWKISLTGNIIIRCIIVSLEIFFFSLILATERSRVPLLKACSAWCMPAMTARTLLKSTSAFYLLWGYLCWSYVALTYLTSYLLSIFKCYCRKMTGKLLLGTWWLTTGCAYWTVLEYNCLWIWRVSIDF